MQVHISATFEPAHEEAAERVCERVAQIQTARVGMSQQRCNIRKQVACPPHPATLGAVAQTRLAVYEVPCKRIEQIHVVPA